MTPEGATFAGYRLLRLLGRGGAGKVYLAESPAGAPGAGQVAIKVYREVGGEPVAQDLMRQAQRAAALQHPNILPCYTSATQGADIAIVMAFAPSGSLGDTLLNGHPTLSLPLRPSTTARIVTQVARALSDAHAQGLIHGDLKPTNLFVRSAPNGSPIVAISDFGHAFLARAAVTSVRQHGDEPPPEWAVTQLAWAAPEQLRGRLTPASDQYGLAALAYYLLAGIQPISAEAQFILNGRVPRHIAPPSQLNPALDDEVDAVLLNALAPQPEQRFGDIVEFASELEDALAPSFTGYTGFGRGATASRQPASQPASRPAREPASQSARQPASSRSGARIDARGPAKRTLAHMSYAAPRPRKPVSRPASIPMVLDAADLPDAAEEPTSLPRRLGLLAPLALLLALFICMVSAILFNPGGWMPAQLDLPGFANANSVPTAASSPSPETTTQAQAESRLRDALASQPVYNDALSGNPAQWTVSGKAIFFGPDQRLHLNNTAKGALFDSMPATAPMPKGAYVATVDVALITAGTGDHAGMRFLVSTATNGDTYYSYLVTPSGRFELWLQQPGAGPVFLTSGYAPSLKQGVGQTNTLAVLVDPVANTLTLFANGNFLYQAPIGKDVALTGRLGVVIPDTGVEAAFAHFAVYNA